MNANASVQRMSHVDLWIRATRFPFLQATELSVVLGAAIAFFTVGHFNALDFLLLALGVGFLHLGTNVANDYFDFRSGNDSKPKPSPFSGGSRVIQEKLVSPQRMLWASMLFFALGSLIGLYFVQLRGFTILWMGLIAVLSGFFYMAPPIKLGYRGLGEFFTFLNCGPLIVAGTFFALTGTITPTAILAGIPIGLLVAAILLVNEFSDAEADQAVGKKTLVVRFGKPNAVKAYVFLVYAAYGFVFAGIIAGLLHPILAIVFISAPQAMGAINLLKQNFGNTPALIPAQAKTIQVHLTFTLLLAVAFGLAALL